MTTLPYSEVSDGSGCFQCGAQALEGVSLCGACMSRADSADTRGGKRLWLGISLASGLTLALVGLAVGVYFREAPTDPIQTPALARMEAEEPAQAGPSAPAKPAPPQPQFALANASATSTASKMQEEPVVKVAPVKPTAPVISQSKPTVAVKPSIAKPVRRKRTVLAVNRTVKAEPRRQERARVAGVRMAKRLAPARRTAKKSGPTYVYLNGGTLLGTWPLKNVKIPAGNHKLVFWNPSSRGRATKSVSVKPGQSVQVNADVKPARRF